MTNHSQLASVQATREVLERHGLHTDKSMGQNFLVNDAIIGHILQLSEAGQGDEILEVGPGIGTLSIALLGAGAELCSVERDKRLTEVLGETTNSWSDHFHLITDDALNITPQDLPFAPNKFIANLPYALAATIVLQYAQEMPSIESFTVMVQSEVAQRMRASVGTKTYGAYTVKLSLYLEPQDFFAVAAGNFFPPPRVESAVIRLNRRTEQLDPALAQAAATMADAAFATRRKTISNSMGQYFSSRGIETSADAIKQVLAACDIDPTCRGETLERADYIRLGQAALSAGLISS